MSKETITIGEIVKIFKEMGYGIICKLDKPFNKCPQIVCHNGRGAALFDYTDICFQLFDWEFHNACIFCKMVVPVGKTIYDLMLENPLGIVVECNRKDIETIGLNNITLAKRNKIKNRKENIDKDFI